MRTQLLDRLRGKGVILSVVDGRVRVKAPAGVLRPADREAISLSRDKLIQALELERTGEHPRERPCAEPSATQSPVDFNSKARSRVCDNSLRRFLSNTRDDSTQWSEDDLDLVDYLMRNIAEGGFWSAYFDAADRYLRRTLPESLYHLLRDVYEREKSRWALH